MGPGTGYYALPVAEWLAPDGQLDVLDVQQEMLDHTLRRAREHGIDNITPARADARELPYPDDSFDGAYLVTVLGEIPDQDAALRELRRVVKPGGRIVVGELFGDPHMVTHGALAGRARRRASAWTASSAAGSGTSPGYEGKHGAGGRRGVTVGA